MLIVHAGLPKTGSTSLQATLWRLREVGELMIQGPIEDLRSFSAARAQVTRFMSRYVNIVITGENLLGSGYLVFEDIEARLSAIEALVAASDGQLLVVFRDHADWLRSLYSEYVWSQQGKLTPHSFMLNISQRPHFSWFTIAKTLSRSEGITVKCIWTSSLSDSLNLAARQVIGGSTPWQLELNQSQAPCCTHAMWQQNQRGIGRRAFKCGHSLDEQDFALNWLTPQNIDDVCVRLDAHDRHNLRQLAKQLPTFTFEEHSFSPSTTRTRHTGTRHMPAGRQPGHETPREWSRQRKPIRLLEWQLNLLVAMYRHFTQVIWRRNKIFGSNADTHQSFHGASPDAHN